MNVKGHGCGECVFDVAAAAAAACTFHVRVQSPCLSLQIATHL